MKSKLFIILCAGLLVAQASAAATIDIHMKNKGTDGAMVFEPGFVLAQPGDTIHFIADDKGHDVASITGMLPEGAEPLKGEMSKDLSVVLTVEGLYGIKCSPHFGLGMVGLIQVGAAANYDTAVAVVQKGKAKVRFDADFAQVTK
ncbi:MAG: pseudoazurin [bacterium]